MENKHKKVRIKWTIELPMEVPEEWDKEMIEFYFNESSWCCSNIIEDLQQYDKDHGCICNICKAEFLEEISKDEIEIEEYFKGIPDRL